MPKKAVRAIGKAVEIFDLSKVYGIEEAMIRVGSAVNDLGMASVAQEGYLIKFVERVAGIAPLAGVSIQNILGLAGALDIYGPEIRSFGHRVQQINEQNGHRNRIHGQNHGHEH